MEIVKLKFKNIHCIRPLWEELNRLHENNSDYFKAHFAAFTFERRLAQLKDTDGIAVFAAKDSGNGDRFTGYCIASTKDRTGEIDSIFVVPDHRKTGLGNLLIDRAESWLKTQDIDKILISVAQGNESAFGFYHNPAM